VELLNALDVPLLGNEVHFTTGNNGYPAFKFTTLANVHKPVKDFIRRLPADFSISVDLWPQIWSNVSSAQREGNREEGDVIAGGFLFAVVNPSNTLLQLGLEVTSYSDNMSSIISFYWADHTTHSEQGLGAVPVVRFNVPDLADKWSSFALSFSADIISLHLDCKLHSTQNLPARTELTFEENSTLWIAQAGPKFNGKFEVYFRCQYNVISRLSLCWE